MASVYMDQISWVEYQQRVEQGAVVFLPCGATEQHGPHLPLGTDALLSTALSADVGRTKRRLLIKYDPRDMSRVFVRRPSGNFVEARYADLTLPQITLHEALTARRALREKGRREGDTRAIVRTVLEQRELVEVAAKRTAAAKRARSRTHAQPDKRELGTLRGIDSSKPVPFVED